MRPAQMWAFEAARKASEEADTLYWAMRERGDGEAEAVAAALAYGTGLALRLYSETLVEVKELNAQMENTGGGRDG